MANTIIEQAADKHFDELMSDDRTGPAVWKTVSHVKKLRENPDSNSSIFGQYFREEHCTRPHLWSYATILSWAIMGKLVMVEIPVGESPSSDSEEEENNHKLGGLPSGISVVFSGGCGDNDGRFQWDVPLKLNLIVDNDIEYGWTVAPCTAPLEVGYTTFHTTWLHLLEEGYLARWPYRSKSVYLIALDHDFRYECLPKLEYKRRFS